MLLILNPRKNHVAKRVAKNSLCAPDALAVVRAYVPAVRYVRRAARRAGIPAG